MSEQKSPTLRLPIYDEHGMATGEIAIATECLKCHALTLAPNFHTVWHAHLEQKFNEIPAHNWTAGPQG